MLTRWCYCVAFVDPCPQLGPEAVTSGDGAAAAAAMGAAACGPASLLSLYLRHDRLAAAVDLVAAAVEAWGRVDVRLRRRHSAAWMPYPQVRPDVRSGCPERHCCCRCVTCSVLRCPAHGPWWPDSRVHFASLPHHRRVRFWVSGNVMGAPPST